MENKPVKEKIKPTGEITFYDPNSGVGRIKKSTGEILHFNQKGGKLPIGSNVRFEFKRSGTGSLYVANVVIIRSK